MKQYPSIPREIKQGLSIYAFDKIDGSHIRCEYNSKKGFYKFGSRKRLLGTDQVAIHKAEHIILNNWSEAFSRIAKKQRWDRAVLFFEFAGPNSFAGTHNENDNHDVWLIDVAPYKKGILPPKEFVDLFGELQITDLLYHGPCDYDFIQSVKKSTLEGVTEEGVVCKAKSKHGIPTMFKIKSERWLTRLKEYCNGDENMFDKLV